MNPCAAWARACIHDDKADRDPSKVIGVCKTSLPAANNDDAVMLRRQTDSLCGVIAIVDRSVSGSITFPVAFRSE